MHASCAGFHHKIVFVLHGHQHGLSGFDTMHLARATFLPTENKYQLPGLGETFARGSCVRGHGISGMALYDTSGKKAEHAGAAAYGDISMGAEVEAGGSAGKIVVGFNYVPALAADQDPPIKLDIFQGHPSMSVPEINRSKTIY